MLRLAAQCIELVGSKQYTVQEIWPQFRFHFRGFLILHFKTQISDER